MTTTSYWKWLFNIIREIPRNSFSKTIIIFVSGIIFSFISFIILKTIHPIIALIISISFFAFIISYVIYRVEEID